MNVGVPQSRPLAASGISASRRFGGAIERAVVRDPDVEGARLQSIHLWLFSSGAVTCAVGLVLDVFVQGLAEAMVWLAFTAYLTGCAIVIARRPRWRRATSALLYVIVLSWVIGSVAREPAMLGYVLPGMWTSVCSAALAEPRRRGLLLNGVGVLFALSLPLLMDDFRGVSIWRIVITMVITLQALALAGYLSSTLWRQSMRDVLAQSRRSERLAAGLQASNLELELRVGQRTRELLDRTADLEAQRQRLQASLEERTRLSAELSELADRDELTGLYNRRFFLSGLRGAVERGGPVSLLILDVDHFKGVNDTYGHPAGDQVLARLARTLTGVVRPGDTVARMGGEEFALFLPGRRPAEAMRVAAACLSQVRQIRFSGALAPVRLTVSIGVASAETDRVRASVAGDWETLIRRADAAMYEAKSAGRDRGVLARSVAPR